MLPEVISSRPATMRSAVVLPHPDGPTSTMSSPSAMDRSSDRTAVVPSWYRLVMPSSTILDTGVSLSGELSRGLAPDAVKPGVLDPGVQQVPGQRLRGPL